MRDCRVSSDAAPVPNLANADESESDALGREAGSVTGRLSFVAASPGPPAFHAQMPMPHAATAIDKTSMVLGRIIENQAIQGFSNA